MFGGDLAFHVHGMLLRIRRTSRGNYTAARRMCTLHLGQSVAAQLVSKNKLEWYVDPVPVYAKLDLESWIYADGGTCFNSTLPRSSASDRSRRSTRSTRVEGNRRRFALVDNVANALTAHWRAGGARRLQRWLWGWLLAELCNLGCDDPCRRVHLEVAIRASVLEQALDRVSKKIWGSLYPWR